MLKSIFSCLKPRQITWLDKLDCVATLPTLERASGREDCLPNTVPQAPKVLTDSELSLCIQQSTAGKLVLALRPVLGETATVQQEVVVIFFNESVAKIFGVPPLRTHTVSTNLVVLNAFEKAESVLFQDVSAHLLRLAAGDPAGGLTLHLAASKYDQPHGVTDTGSSVITALATSSTCQATPSSSSARSRVWQYAIVEPVMLASPASSRVVDRTYTAAGVRPAVIVTFIAANPACAATVLSGKGRSESVHRSHMDPYVGESSLSSVTIAGPPAKADGAQRDTAVPMAGPRRSIHLTNASSYRGVTSRSAIPGSDSASQHAAWGGEHLTITKPLPAPETSPSPSMYTVGALATRGGAEDVAQADQETLRLRADMVLSGMSPIVTAFGSNGGGVLYQNNKSTLYFGDRMPAAASAQRVKAPDSRNRSKSVDLKETAGGVLAELFCFEAAKLERMIAEVAVEGRTWKGILQVPSSCHRTLLPFEGQETKGGDGACSPAAPRSLHMDESPGPASPGGATCLPSKRTKFIKPTSTSVAASGASAAQLQVPVAMPQIDVGGNMGVVARVSNRGGFWSIMQNVASPNTTTTDMAVNPDGSANGRLSTAPTTDVDPLATSTWGLLLDTGDQPAPLEPYTRANRPNSMHTLLLAAACVDTAQDTVASKISAAEREPVMPSSQQAEAAASLARTSCMAQDLVPCGNASQSVGSCAPRFRPNADLGSVRLRKQLNRFYDPRLVRQSLRSATNSRHDFVDTETKLITRAKSSVHPGYRIPPMSLQGRCLSGRADLGVGGSALRVVTFASSLNIMPTSVQAALQQALATSAGSGVPGGSGANGSNAAVGEKELQTLADWVYSSRGSDRWEQTMPQPSDSAYASSCQYLSREGGRVAAETANKPLVGSHTFKDAGKVNGAPNDAPNAVEAAQSLQSPPTLQAVSWSRSANDQLNATLPSSPRPSTPRLQPACSSAPSPKPSRWSSSKALAKHVIQQSTMPAGGDARGGEGHNGGTGGEGGECHISGQQRCHTVGPGTAYAWHEVSATLKIDPVTGQHAIIVVQVDVTAKVEAERHLAFITEAEHRLLEQVFPRHVLAYMTEEIGHRALLRKGDMSGSKEPILCDINALATSHAEVTLLFADIQGFTHMCEVLEPRVVMAFLNDLYTRFDRGLDEFGVYKVETIGDCYFVAGGLVHEDKDGMLAVRDGAGHEDRLHAERVFMFAKAMLEAASQVALPTTGGPVQMRIGIHSGPVVSGMVGQRMPRFCLFGDTVNTTSRMESTGVSGCIHASEAAYELLRHEAWMPTGGIEVKGKGPMNTYLWAPPDEKSQALLADHVRRRACNGNGAIATAGDTNAAVPAVSTEVTEDKGFGQTTAEHTILGPIRVSGSRGRNASYSAGGFLQVWLGRSARLAANKANSVRSGPSAVDDAVCGVINMS